MDNNATNPNAGNPADQNLDNPDLGNQGGEGQQPGAPGGQGGQQPDPRDAELETLRANNRALNQRLIDARRGGQQPQNPQPDGSLFETPEGQYAISLELATGNLSRQLETRLFSLYPELPPEEIQRVRANPWAFASLESFKTGDVESALLEIDSALMERVNQIKPGEGQGGGQPAQDNPNPATVNTNPALEQDQGGEPGSAEDANPWTMPMDKLEKEKNKKLAQLQTKS